MGWTGFSKYQCITNANGSVNKKATLDCEFNRWGDTVIKSAMGGGNWYGIVENGDGVKFLAVVLVTIDGDEFLYKDMSDTMGPYQTDCPKSILDLADQLCPCTDEYDPNGWAREWRKKCRAKINEKNLPTAFKNVKLDGDVIWHVPKDSYLMMGGESIAGRSLHITKVKGRRSWLHYSLHGITRIPTKYVNPADCELA